ncbi:hypothetical protein ABKN59_010981 [Abortiporus biennis]
MIMIIHLLQSSSISFKDCTRVLIIQQEIHNSKNHGSKLQFPLETWAHDIFVIFYPVPPFGLYRAPE